MLCKSKQFRTSTRPPVLRYHLIVEVSRTKVVLLLQLRVQVLDPTAGLEDETAVDAMDLGGDPGPVGELLDKLVTSMVYHCKLRSCKSRGARLPGETLP